MARTNVWRLRARLAWLGARGASRRAVDTVEPRRILVVCHGNIYRSPLAAAVLGTRMAGWSEVRSAGFHPVGGRPAPPEHVAACLRLDVDLTRHRSSVVTADDIAWADVIVIMDRHNWRHLVERGAGTDRLVWLGTFDGGRELADPYGRAAVEAERIASRVHRCAERLADAILARRRSMSAGQP